MRFADKVTIGEKYGPAMNIEELAAAAAYFEDCVEHTMRMAGASREKAEEIERANLGYYAGYYSDETRARVERLFRCAHPIFGALPAGNPSPEQALGAGRKMARG